MHLNTGLYQLLAGLLGLPNLFVSLTLYQIAQTLNLISS